MSAICALLFSLRYRVSEELARTNIIDTATQPNRDELEALADGCNLLVLLTTPDALAIDALMQTVDQLQTLKSDRFSRSLRFKSPTSRISSSFCDRAFRLKN